jgi:hypothetical protein
MFQPTLAQQLPQPVQFQQPAPTPLPVPFQQLDFEDAYRHMHWLPRHRQ